MGSERCCVALALVRALLVHICFVTLSSYMIKDAQDLPWSTLGHPFVIKSYRHAHATALTPSHTTHGRLETYIPSSARMSYESPNLRASFDRTASLSSGLSNLHVAP